MKKEIKFLTPIDSTVLPFNLTINLAKVLNVFHLKQKLSRTFYTPIEFINIVYDSICILTQETYSMTTAHH